MKQDNSITLLASAMSFALSCVCVSGTQTLAPTQTPRPPQASPTIAATDTDQPAPTQTSTPTATLQPPSPTPTTPPPDTSGPPAPVLVSPINDIDPGCVPFVGLVWNTVSDPSGIDHYDIELQVNYGSGWVTAGEWQASGPRSVPHECGYPHRWRVRAVDGVGNEGNFSVWGTFASP